MKRLFLLLVPIVLLSCQPSKTATISNPISQKSPVNLGPAWTVTNVHDGDTLRATQNGEEIKVRFACVDAPELSQPLGQASRDYLRSLISKADNKVQLLVVDTDRYGRKVAEVFADSKLIQSQQTEAGMAYVYERYLNNCPNAKSVQQSQTVAQSKKVGVWSGVYQTPWEYRQAKRSK